MTHPHCHTRQLLVETEAGPRVDINKLFASFTPRERSQWDRWAGQAAMDEFGIIEAGVERFLSEVERVEQRRLFA